MMDFGSGSRGRGKNKRPWTRQEEEFLIKGLLELSADPSWKADGCFKNGFKTKLEEMLNERFPGCGLRAVPHIESKIKWFKDKYKVLCEMSRASGFSWDDRRHMIVCDRETYEEFCRKHKHAQGLWNLSFPWYDQLSTIFGVDRTNGANSEPFLQIVENRQADVLALDKDQSGGDDENDDMDSVSQSAESIPSDLSTRNARKEKTPREKGKKRKMPEVPDLTCSLNDMSSTLCRSMNEMNTHMSTIASALSTTQQHEQAVMAREQAMEHKKKNLIKELLRVPGLTRYETILASKKLASNESDLTLFYESPDDQWKKEFVLSFIHPDSPLNDNA